MRPVTFTTKGALGKASLREANERLVLTHIVHQPGISRLAIARSTSLSPSAITGIVERLKDAGLVVDEKTEATAMVGRPPSNLRLVKGSRNVVAVEITPFDASLAVADLVGNIVDRREVAADKDPETFLERAHKALVELIEGTSAPILGVGVSIQGILDPATGQVIAATNLNWRNVEAIRILRQGIDLPFYWDNNANLSALAEQWFAAPGSASLDNFVFVTLRGGLGTGLIFGGHLVQGATARAGEFGHTVLYPDGRKCLCGNHGCWEEYASDKALCRLYHEHGGEEICDSLEVIRRAKAGDVAALAATAEVGRNLGLGLMNVITGLNPAAICLDDFAACGWDLIEPAIWDVLRSRVPDYWLAGVRIFPSEHAIHASLSGAVALALSKYFTSFHHGQIA